MTILLKNGDYARDTQGRVAEADGQEALIQQALIRMQARKGCFPLDRELGSELYRLDLNRAGVSDIEPLLREALAPLRGLELTGLERSMDRDSGRLLLTVRLRTAGREADVSLELL